jgi:hypothetical protein
LEEPHSDILRFIKANDEVELFHHIIRKTKAMLEDGFGVKPSVYHDGERRLVIDVASEIYRKIQ